MATENPYQIGVVWWMCYPESLGGEEGEWKETERGNKDY